MTKGYTITPTGLVLVPYPLEYVEPELEWDAALKRNVIIRAILVTTHGVVAVPIAEVRETVNRGRR